MPKGKKRIAVKADLPSNLLLLLSLKASNIPPTKQIHALCHRHIFPLIIKKIPLTCTLYVIHLLMSTPPCMVQWPGAVTQ